MAEIYSKEWEQEKFNELAPEVESIVRRAYPHSRGASFGAQGATLARRLMKLRQEIASEAEKRRFELQERKRQEERQDRNIRESRQREDAIRTQNQQEARAERDRQQRLYEQYMETQKQAGAAEADRQLRIQTMDPNKSPEENDLNYRAAKAELSGDIQGATAIRKAGTPSQQKADYEHRAVQDKREREVSGATDEVSRQISDNPTIRQQGFLQSYAGTDKPDFRSENVEERMYGLPNASAVVDKTTDNVSPKNISSRSGFYRNYLDFPTVDNPVPRYGGDQSPGFDSGKRVGANAPPPERREIRDASGRRLTTSTIGYGEFYTPEGKYTWRENPDPRAGRLGGHSGDYPRNTDYFLNPRTKGWEYGVPPADFGRTNPVTGFYGGRGARDTFDYYNPTKVSDRLKKETDQAYLRDRPGSFDPYTPGKRTDAYNRDLGSGDITPGGFRKTWRDSYNYANDTAKNVWGGLRDAWRSIF